MIYSASFWYRFDFSSLFLLIMFNPISVTNVRQTTFQMWCSYLVKVIVASLETVSKHHKGNLGVGWTGTDCYLHGRWNCSTRHRLVALCVWCRYLIESDRGSVSPRLKGPWCTYIRVWCGLLCLLYGTCLVEWNAAVTLTKVRRGGVSSRHEVPMASAERNKRELLRM